MASFREEDFEYIDAKLAAGNFKKDVTLMVDKKQKQKVTLKAGQENELAVVQNLKYDTDYIDVFSKSLRHKTKNTEHIKNGLAKLDTTFRTAKLTNGGGAGNDVYVFSAATSPAITNQIRVAHHIPDYAEVYLELPEQTPAGPLPVQCMVWCVIVALALCMNRYTTIE